MTLASLRNRDWLTGHERGSLKLFERDLPIQLGIESQKYLAQTSSGMRAE